LVGWCGFDDRNCALQTAYMPDFLNVALCNDAVDAVQLRALVVMWPINC